MTEFDLRAMLESLHRHDVQFVVIGGVAVAAHGYVRGTEDLDLVPDPDPANLARLTDCLEELDSTRPTVGRAFDPSTDVAVIHRGGNVTADTRFGGLDIVQRAIGVPGYSELVRDAVESELLGVPVRICSLARLRGMKRAAGRDQDRLDLSNLPEA